MMSCHVSEYLNTGPVPAHMTMVVAASIKAVELPVALVAQLANFSKKFFFLVHILKFYT